MQCFYRATFLSMEHARITCTVWLEELGNCYFKFHSVVLYLFCLGMKQCRGLNYEVFAYFNYHASLGYVMFALCFAYFAFFRTKFYFQNLLSICYVIVIMSVYYS